MVGEVLPDRAEVLFGLMVAYAHETGSTKAAQLPLLILAFLDTRVVGRTGAAIPWFERA